jgi:hypothetical protein
MADVQTILEVFLNVFLRSTCFSDKAFSGKKQTFWSWEYYPQVLDYQAFQIIGHQIKGILLYLLCLPYFAVILGITYAKETVLLAHF